MWGPGVHKIRATLTSPQGRETTQALNLIRLPPSQSASLDVLNASGDSELWPAISQGDKYEPTPLFMTLPATIALVGAGGFVFALLVGLFVGKRMGQEPEVERDIWDTVEQPPDSDGLPTFVDDSGVHWRQQPDGSVDWWDAGEKRWELFQE